MKKQIATISAHQSAKVLAILYVILTLPFCLIGIIGYIVSMLGASPDPASPGPTFPFGLLIFMPIIYGSMGYVFFAIFCWVYNFVAKRVGGFEFTVTERGGK